jgi:hypothetical protein
VTEQPWTRTFTAPLPPADNPLWDIVLDAMSTEQRFDVAMEPSVAERKPCRQCGVPGEKVTYHGMIPIAPAEAEGRSGVVRMTINNERVAFADLQRVTFEPCGHVFDGRTGEPITEA